MSFVQLKKTIKTKLEGISDIQEVADYPTENFQGYPAAMVRSEGNVSDYETTQENEEVYTFTVILVQVLDGTHDEEKARDIMEALCDTVRDSFDSDEFLSGISLPADRAMIGVHPTVSRIGVEDEGKFVVAEIELACKVIKTI